MTSQLINCDERLINWDSQRINSDNQLTNSATQVCDDTNLLAADVEGYVKAAAAARYRVQVVELMDPQA
eukprot:3739665-Pyramimonas_sp.AAC.1